MRDESDESVLTFRLRVFHRAGPFLLLAAAALPTCAIVYMLIRLMGATPSTDPFFRALEALMYGFGIGLVGFVCIAFGLALAGFGVYLTFGYTSARVELHTITLRGGVGRITFPTQIARNTIITIRRGTSRKTKSNGRGAQVVIIETTDERHEIGWAIDTERLDWLCGELDRLAPVSTPPPDPPPVEVKRDRAGAPKNDAAGRPLTDPLNDVVPGLLRVLGLIRLGLLPAAILFVAAGTTLAALVPAAHQVGAVFAAFGIFAAFITGSVRTIPTEGESRSAADLDRTASALGLDPHFFFLASGNVPNSRERPFVNTIKDACERVLGESIAIEWLLLPRNRPADPFLVGIEATTRSGELERSSKRYVAGAMFVPLDWPKATISRKGAFDDVATMLRGKRDIEAESDEFNKAFRVRCEDGSADFALALLTPDVQRYMVDLSKRLPDHTDAAWVLSHGILLFAVPEPPAEQQADYGVLLEAPASLLGRTPLAEIAASTTNPGDSSPSPDHTP